MTLQVVVHCSDLNSGYRQDGAYMYSATWDNNYLYNTLGYYIWDASKTPYIGSNHDVGCLICSMGACNFTNEIASNSYKEGLRMKKFTLGLALGLSFALTSTAFSSNAVSTTLFPSQFVFNGQTKTLGSEYEVLNYNGHAYVPVRFVAENMGATVGYDDNGALPLVSINYFPPNTAIYTDPTFARSLHVGNIQVKSSDDQFIVSGLVTVDPGASSRKNHPISFGLHFLNDKGEQIGVAVLGVTYVSEGEIHYFEIKTRDNVDVTGYSDIQLHVDLLDSIRLPPGKP